MFKRNVAEEARKRRHRSPNGRRIASQAMHAYHSEFLPQQAAESSARFRKRKWLAERKVRKAAQPVRPLFEI